LESAIAAYISYVKVEKGLAANTVESYRRDLTRFAAFMGKRKRGLRDISREDIVEYLGNLYRERLDSRSVARHQVSLRNFFRFTLVENFISIDPTLNLESPKIRKSLPFHLRKDEVDRL